MATARYALVKNNQVKEILELDSTLVTAFDYAGFVQSDTAVVGNLYVNGEFVNPGTNFPIPIVPLPYLTKLAFRNRFTQAEKVAIYTAKVNSIPLQIFLDDVNTATYIDPFRPDTLAGVFGLEQAGILATGRAKEIITTDITQAEVWIGQR